MGPTKEQTRTCTVERDPELKGENDLLSDLRYKG